MLAAETREGLERLSVEHFTTQEVFWSQVEGRLMAMLDGEKELTLELLNRATQAWIEQEYAGPARPRHIFERVYRGGFVVSTMPISP